MDVSIIIVNWESDGQLRNCLKSIDETIDSTEYEVFIIDNNSETIDFDQIEADFSGISQFEFISLSENRGGDAVNVVKDEIAGKYVLFLGPDTVLHSGAVDNLFTYLEKNEGVGAASAKLLNPDGSNQLYYYHFWNIPMVFYIRTIVGTVINKYVHNSKKSKYYYNIDLDVDSNPEVDQPPGACLMVQKDLLLQDGYLIDPKFKFYFNDVDVCKRVYNRGYTIHIVSEAEVTHDQGSSFDKRAEPWKRAETAKSLVRYFKKHEGNKKYIVQALLLLDFLIRPFAMFTWFWAKEDLSVGIDRLCTESRVIKQYLSL